MRSVTVELRDLVIEFGGANSSEHGDGLARSEFNRIIFGDALYDAMYEVKQLSTPGEAPASNCPVGASAQSHRPAPCQLFDEVAQPLPARWVPQFA
jgi:hypothetical protein